MINKNLLIVSRGGHFKNNHSMFFQNQDGPYLDGIIKEFSKVEILSLKYDEKLDTLNYQFESKNVNITSFPNQSSKFKKLFSYLLLFKTVYKYDTVMIFIPMPSSIFTFFYAKILRKDIICYSGLTWKDIVPNKNNFFNRLRRSFYSSIELIISKSSNICLLNNNYLYNKIKNLPFVEKTKPLSTIKIGNTKINLKLKNIDKSKTIQLVSMGSVIQRKSYDTTIEALKELSFNTNFKFQLNIIGTISDKKYYEELVKYIDENNLNEFVIFHGYKNSNEISEILPNMDIFIMASKTEGFPRVIWEAMLFNLPVVSTSLENIKNEFENKELCLFIDIENSKDMANNILKLVDNNNLRNKLISNSITYIKNIYSETASSQVLRLYNECKK